MRMVEVKDCPDPKTGYGNPRTIYFDLDDISIITPVEDGSKIYLKTGKELFVPINAYDLAFQSRIVARF